MKSAAFLIQFFKALEQRVPPRAGLHHTMYGALYGSDKEGWHDVLCVAIQDREKPPVLLLDDSDLEKPIPQLVEEIAAIVATARKEP